MIVTHLRGFCLMASSLLSFISFHSPHVQTFVSFFWFLGVCLGRCLALHYLPAVCCLVWSHSPRQGSAGPGAAPAQLSLGGPGSAGALAAPGIFSGAPPHRNLYIGFVFSLIARNGAAIGCVSPDEEILWWLGAVWSWSSLTDTQVSCQCLALGFFVTNSEDFVVRFQDKVALYS